MCVSIYSVFVCITDGTKIRVDDLAQAMEGFVISYGFMGWNKFARQLENPEDFIRKIFTEGDFSDRCHGIHFRARANTFLAA